MELGRRVALPPGRDATVKPVTAVILYGKKMPVERLGLLNEYARFFASTVHVGQWTLKEACQAIECNASVQYMQNARELRQFAYAHLRTALALLPPVARSGCAASGRTRTLGALVFHADFWVRSRHVRVCLAADRRMLLGAGPSAPAHAPRPRL